MPGVLQGTWQIHYLILKITKVEDDYQDFIVISMKFKILHSIH